MEANASLRQRVAELEAEVEDERRLRHLAEAAKWELLARRRR